MSVCAAGKPPLVAASPIPHALSRAGDGSIPVAGLQRFCAHWLISLTMLPAFSPAMAAPLVWQVETATDPTGQTPSQLDRPQVPSGKPLVWTMDPGAPSTAGLANEGSTSTNKAAPAQSSQDLAPNGYPRYGIPVEQPFPMPYIGGAVPSAYIADWGSYYFGLSGATPGKLRAGSVDGSVNAGLGFGDFRRTLALQIDWGIGSIKNFGANGGFSFSAGRMLVEQPRLQISAAGGVYSFYTYGTEGNPEPSTGYGVITIATPLRPARWDFPQVLQFSLGYGGYQFGYIDPITFEADNSGFFAALGLQVTQNVGLSAGWTPRGSNLNLSYTPFRDLPFYVNLSGLDLFDVSPWGPRGVLTLSWGDNFRTALF